jgi:hypothetical protein
VEVAAPPGGGLESIPPIPQHRVRVPPARTLVIVDIVTNIVRIWLRLLHRP